MYFFLEVLRKSSVHVRSPENAKETVPRQKKEELSESLQLIQVLLGHFITRNELYD